MTVGPTERRETANAIRHCLHYLLQDAVAIGLTSSAAQIRLAIEELDHELPRVQHPELKLVHLASTDSSPPE